MKRVHSFLLFTTLIWFGTLPVGAANYVFPNDTSVLNLKTDFGAVGDGVANDTVALQNAFNASSGSPTKILFIPNGVYLVTNTIVDNSRNGPWVYGESETGAVIRLADNITQSPYYVTNCTAVLRTLPNDTNAGSADWFMRSLNNFTVDVGQNPGVDGIRWFGNNTSILKDVTVLGNGVGNIGINPGWMSLNGPNIIEDCIVVGFNTGINVGWFWGETISRVTISNCLEQGIYVTANCAAIEDLTVANTPIALNVDSSGVAALVGGNFTGGSPTEPAINNAGQLYARNVTASGFQQVLYSSTTGGSVTGTNLAEYSSTTPIKLYTDAPNGSFMLPIKPEPVIPWETNLANWVCANNYGLMSGTGHDNTAAFQAAIDAAASAGATTVYLRGSGGAYYMSGEVHVHGSVQRIMALGWGNVIASGSNAEFYVDDASAPVVKFQNIQAFGAAPVTAENRSSTNTLVLESCDMTVLGTGQGDIFATDCASRADLLSPEQSLWARQLNPEGIDDIGIVRNYGGKLWDLGFKSEGAGVRFRTVDGGQTEVCGVFMYDTDVPANDPRPMFDVDNSPFCAMGVFENTYGNAYLEKVREVRIYQGVNQVHEVQQGGQARWALYSGWVPAETNGPTAVTMPTIEPVGSSFLESGLLSQNSGNYNWAYPGQGSFVDSLALSGATTTSGAQLRYTTDGSEPTTLSPLWPAPLTVTNTVILKVKGFDPSSYLAPSATYTSSLTKVGSTYSGPPAAIGAQFSGDGNNGANLLSPKTAAGVFVQTNWNVINLQGGGGNPNIDNGTYGSMKDAGGRTTAVQLQYAGDDAWNTGGSTTTPNYKLMQGTLKQDTTGTKTMTLTFSNVPAGNYDVYVYGDVDGGPTTLSLNIGTVTYYWQEPSSFSGTFTQAASTNPNAPASGNYVKFRGVAPVNGAIKITAMYRSGGGGSGGPEFGICGLQLVSRDLSIMTAGPDVVLSFAQGILLQAPTPNGPWTTNSAAIPPSYTIPLSQAQQFYRLLIQ